ncbi:MAG TPA: aspartate aminotransferase family protein [Cytophagales bacterium]|nr:aspartate aminotransferase family protein [Cytophagales bacterium]HAP62939.1 aspartate aminotransferase family protein [Cytophagales bacterium]
MHTFSQELDILAKALPQLARAFDTLPAATTTEDFGRMQEVLQEVAERMGDNYPYHHPQYAGQMLKPPHPIARMAYLLAMYLNPNNHALDGGRASSAMEKEAVTEIAAMYGWEQHLGHLTGGGTVANLEALWVAGRSHPDQLIVASNQAHYTHSRITEVLGLPYRSVATDAHGRMDLAALEEILQQDEVGTVVATVGSTGVGAVDPLPGLLALKREYGFRIHVDSAYGGYFTLASQLSAEVQVVYDALDQVDSLVVDPHKHGLQPYGCGCVLFADPSVAEFYKHDSPYTYYSSAEPHLGEISLECSRAGAAAVALWATQKLLPLTRHGEFSGMLDKNLQAARKLYDKAKASEKYFPFFYPSIDILIFAPVGSTISQISERSKEVFQKSAEKDVHLALFQYPVEKFSALFPDVEVDSAAPYVACLRSCLMKPEHLEAVDRLWEIMERVA